MVPKPDSLSAIALADSGAKYAHQIGSSLMLAVRRWQLDDGSSMAAAVAYYLALSLFPMLLLLTAGVGITLRYTRLGQDAERQILSVVAEHCSPTLEVQVRQVLLNLREHSVVGGPFGLVTAVLAAIGVFYQFERAFDKIWRIPPSARSGWYQLVLRVLTERLTAFLLLAAVGCAIVAILAANVAIGAVREWMLSLRLPGSSLVIASDALTTVFLNMLAFGALYRWLPKRPVLWQDALRGGLLVSLIWEGGRQVLSVFLIGMRYTTAYGAIGSFIALLLWFYWGVTILFFGAEYVQVLSRRHARPLSMFRGQCPHTAAGQRFEYPAGAPHAAGPHAAGPDAAGPDAAGPDAAELQAAEPWPCIAPSLPRTITAPPARGAAPTVPRRAA